MVFTELDSRVNQLGSCRMIDVGEAKSISQDTAVMLRPSVFAASSNVAN